MTSIIGNTDEEELVLIKAETQLEKKTFKNKDSSFEQHISQSKKCKKKLATKKFTAIDME